MDVIKKYNINFFEREDIGKDLSTNNDILSCYVWEHRNIQETDQSLRFVDQVLKGISLEIEYPTKSLYVIIFTESVVKIYDDADEWERDNNREPTYTLPTLDFKIILEAWRNFLIE